MAKKELMLRAGYAFLGVAVLALGATILRIGQVGLDPFTASNIALGGLVGLSLGVYQLLTNLVILVLIFIFGRKYIGLGTLINMVLAGFLIDLFTGIFTNFDVEVTQIWQQGLCLIIGILLFSFGASFYMGAQLGNAPYDAIAPTIVDKTGWQYRSVRVTQDILFTLVGFFLHGPIGVGTFISAFLTGPFISFWDKKITRPVMTRSIKKVTER